MKTLNQIKANQLQLILILSVSFYADQLFSFNPKGNLPAIANVYQKDQAKELLGPKQYKKTMKVKANSNHILGFVEKHLPKKHKYSARTIAETIIQEARRNKLDPMFLMAVIMTESSFNPEAKGLHGEIGLMQILPKTAEWLAKKHKISGKIDLRDARINIRLGAAYFGNLRAKFSRVGNRYIAAYNMGARNVNRLVKSKVEPKIYSDKVISHYKGIYKHIEIKTTQNSRVAAL